MNEDHFDITPDDARLAEGQAAFLAYWQELRGDRIMPDRRELAAARVRPFLNNLVVFERDGVTNGWWVRLTGPAIVEKESYDMVGHLVAEHPDAAHARAVATNLELIADARRPCYTVRQRLVSGHPWLFTNIVVPFSDDGTVVNVIMSCTHFEV